MASISTDKAGRRRILFTNGTGERKAIRLGKVPMKLANEIKLKVEALNAAKVSGLSLDTETAGWVSRIGDDLAGKLAAAGLIESRSTATATLGAFLDQYIGSRADVAANTRRNLTQSARYLVTFFGTGRELRKVTGGDADAFGFQMHGRYAEATACRAIKHARQFFKAAHRAGLVAGNPFSEVEAGSMDNRERMYFLDRADAEKLLAATPDPEWQLIVALSRFGGLRTPSEHLVLTWADMDWARGRFLVRSTKTGPRWVPMFPELRPHLETAFERAEPGAVHVVTRTRDAKANWRTTFEKIIYRAGLLPWPKLFQNMRATRETELARDYPLHVVTSWIGNSAPVAAKHYLQVTDADFERAGRGGAESGAAGAQKAAQSGAVGMGRDETRFAETPMPRDVVHPVASHVNYSTVVLAPLTGVEPVF